jgi:YidC/Oxa1 family membrane protein insertase
VDVGAIYESLREAIAGPMTTLLVMLYGQLALMGLPSWGLTIIVFTMLVKLVFWPLTMQQLRASKAMQSLQPQLADLKKLHGKDKEKLMQEQMRLYKENRVNPMAGCLPMLIQLPIWIGLYQALFTLASKPDFASPFLWISNLALPEPNIPVGIPILAVLTALSQFVVQRMMQVNTTDPQQKSMNQAMQFMPIMYLFISAHMPAGLVLYWVASNTFTMIQQSFYTGWKGVIPAGLIPGLGAKAPAVVESRPRREPVVVAPSQLNGPSESANVVLGRNELATTNTPPRRTKKRRK